MGSLLRLLPFSFIILVLTFLFTSCSHKTENLMESSDMVFFYDDLPGESLEKALHHHLNYLNRGKQEGGYQFADHVYDTCQLRESLQHFLRLYQESTSPFKLNSALHRDFAVFQAGGRKTRRGEMLVTGYYEPILQGSLTKKPPYIYPLYAQPADLLSTKDTNGKLIFGQYNDQGDFRPYWSREKIESSEILLGEELVYLKDPIERFILHIQGSGKIFLPNGEIRTIRYQANNGHTYSSIGKLLVDEGKMALKDVDLPAIRNYLQNHPHDMQRIFNHNKRYIFFEWGPEAQSEVHPRGSLNLPLTPGRSIALDPDILPTGLIAYIISRKPEVDEMGRITGWVPLHRFVFGQDSGAAIKGAGRVDLFWGSSSFSEIAAGAMKEPGKLYFLLKKDSNECKP